MSHLEGRFMGPPPVWVRFEPTELTDCRALFARTAAGPRPFIASGTPKKYHCRARTRGPPARAPVLSIFFYYQLLTFFPSFGSAYHNNIQGTSFSPEIRAQRYAPLLSFSVGGLLIRVSKPLPKWSPL